MSQQDVERVREAMAAFTAQPPDLESLNVLIDPDHLFISDWGVEGREYRGARGLAEGIADVDAMWQEWRQEVEDILDAGGGRVLVLLRLTARGRESGAPVDWRWAMLITLRDGKAIASRTYVDRARALEAAGLAQPS
jgi:ketosteroid isomerase-like protein